MTTLPRGRLLLYSGSYSFSLTRTSFAIRINEEGTSWDLMDRGASAWEVCEHGGTTQNCTLKMTILLSMPRILLSRGISCELLLQYSFVESCSCWRQTFGHNFWQFLLPTFCRGSHRPDDLGTHSSLLECHFPCYSSSNSLWRGVTCCKLKSPLQALLGRRALRQVSVCLSVFVI